MEEWVELRWRTVIEEWVGEGRKKGGAKARMEDRQHVNYI